MTEKLLHFIWQFQYFNRSALETADGEPTEVRHPGTLNPHQGPDFSGASIYVGGALLAGSVELHVRTSDWHRHQHSNDSNYANVILHVVWQHDALFQKSIPVLELQSRVPNLLLKQYEMLMQTQAFIPCGSAITSIKSITWLAWKERLVATRLERKAQALLQNAAQQTYHWEQVFWQILARHFGGVVNADAFEELARSLPLSILLKHRNNLQQLEALLLGQANLLPEAPVDAFSEILLQEYQFLKAKFQLQPIHTPIYFLRMRPGNFPTVRLAQLAMLLHNNTHLFATVLEATSVDVVKKQIGVTAGTYWQTHYRIGMPSANKLKTVGSATADVLLINSVIPILFAYGLHHGHDGYKEKAISWLQTLQCETNAVVNGFKALGVTANTAHDSQALLQLKTHFCDTRRCLDCAVGNALLKPAT